MLRGGSAARNLRPEFTAAVVGGDLGHIPFALAGTGPRGKDFFSR